MVGPGCSRAETEVAKEAAAVEKVDTAMVVLMEMGEEAAVKAESEAHPVAVLEAVAAKVQAATVSVGVGVVATMVMVGAVATVVMVATGCSA